jgi:hypothetical protein
LKPFVPLCLASLAALAPAQETPAPVAAPVPAAPAPVASEPVPPPPAPAPEAIPAPAAAGTSAPSVPAAASPTPAVAAPAASSAAAPAAASSESGTSGGVQFHPGLTFGTVTVDGKTWTRLSFQPEIEIGKLGIALDLEMFLDENQNLSSRGWEFGSTQETVESLLRKIYYVRWDHPGATFYAKAGALDNVTLAHGLVVSGYRNTARYPDYKLLGLHSQLNDIGALGWDAEILINSVQDLSKKGPFWAGRLGLRPLKPSGAPVFKDLRVGAGVARDESQFSGLRDRDGDDCPDLVDEMPGNGSTCVGDMSYLIQDRDLFPDAMTVQTARGLIDSVEQVRSDSLAGVYGRKMAFTELWLDAELPLFKSDFFTLGVYSEFAKPITPDDTLVSGLGWGAIPVGAWSKIGPVDLIAEYRLFRGPFQPGWFNANYELDRARQVGTSIQPKTQLVYGLGASRALLQGYFAGAGVDLWGILKVYGDYSHLTSSGNAPDQRALSGRAGLGKTLLDFTKKISVAEVYWRKDRIGLDTWEDTLGVAHKDGFFDRSTFNAYGWRLGSLAAPGVELTVQRETTFSRKADGSLKSETQMAIASQVRF